MSANELEEVKVETLLKKPEPKADPHDVTNHGLRDIWKDRDHRKLAICSIICGISCFGIMSLMYSVKARETRKRHEDGQKYSKKACRWGIVSIVAWVVLILIFPLLIVFLSFIVTFID
ncbi:hypothetical protein R3I93_001829 [Phoxinus phoxinus]|uniref:Transmembrane protein 265 n=1 Tax=Phoxinus phoxinus TaxID=58324 RepID=A0AAN9DI70_9TELE